MNKKKPIPIPTPIPQQTFKQLIDSLEVVIICRLGCLNCQSLMQEIASLQLTVGQMDENTPNVDIQFINFDGPLAIPELDKIPTFPWNQVINLPVVVSNKTLNFTQGLNTFQNIIKSLEVSL